MASKQTDARLELADLPLLLTVSMAAATGAGCERQIRSMCESGEIRATKCGRTWRIPRDLFLQQFGLA